MMFSKILFASLVVTAIFCNCKAKNSTESDERVMKRNEIPFNPYYNPFIPAYSYIAEAEDEPSSFYRRFPTEKLLFKGLPFRSAAENEQPESRLFALNSLINAGLFNNRFQANNRPVLAGIGNRLPVTRNPEFPDLLSTFDGCTAPNGESGICAPSSVCTVFGGRPSGSCPFGKVCCINVVTRCGATVTLNNTYWQSPATPVSSSTSCTLNVRLDDSLREQKLPICQVRLDFISFTISQPNAETVCATDSFQVGGTLNQVPTICGDNNEQHMYLNVPNSGLTPSDVQLMFTFTAGTGVVPRSWNIKIAMLPCGASYLAPPDCLQYFLSTSGTIRTFNWRDVPLATRQLANQDYSICFRPELVNGQRANTSCVSECAVTNANAAFRLTGAATTAQAFPTATANPCNNDYLVIPGGFDPTRTAATATAPLNSNDRYCGGALNAVGASAAAGTVCTNADPYRLYYKTNGDETVTAPVEATNSNNIGFCLNFIQRNP